MIVTTRQHPNGLEIVEYERDYFLENIWEIKPGNRITILGPSEAGKTTLGYQLLDHSTSPKFPGIVLVMKPNDETAEKFSREAGYEIIRTWPPKLDVFNPRKKPRGWTLWPTTDFDPEHGDARTMFRQYREFVKVFANVYQKGNKIIFADELASLVEELKLGPQVKRAYSKGRSQKASILGGTQRPSEIPLLAYSSASDIFLAYDPDERDRKRFAEIGGGIDPKMVEEVTLQLPQYWWLYLRRRDRTTCIVRA